MALSLNKIILQHSKDTIDPLYIDTDILHYTIQHYTILYYTTITEAFIQHVKVSSNKKT